MKRARKLDSRPICTCPAYKFPHRIGGKCTGSHFAERYYWENRTLCRYCNCNNQDSCDVATGLESISEAECYQELTGETNKPIYILKTLALL